MEFWLGDVYSEQTVERFEDIGYGHVATVCGVDFAGPREVAGGYLDVGERRVRGRFEEGSGRELATVANGGRGRVEEVPENGVQ